MYYLIAGPLDKPILALIYLLSLRAHSELKTALPSQRSTSHGDAGRVSGDIVHRSLRSTLAPLRDIFFPHRPQLVRQDRIHSSTAEDASDHRKVSQLVNRLNMSE